MPDNSSPDTKDHEVQIIELERIMNTIDDYQDENVGVAIFNGSLAQSFGMFSGLLIDPIRKALVKERNRLKRELKINESEEG